VCVCVWGGLEALFRRRGDGQNNKQKRHTRRKRFDITTHTPHYCTALHCSALHCTVLHCTALTLHYSALHYTTLHYTILHYTTLTQSAQVRMHRGGERRRKEQLSRCAHTTLPCVYLGLLYCGWFLRFSFLLFLRPTRPSKSWTFPGMIFYWPRPPGSLLIRAFDDVSHRHFSLWKNTHVLFSRATPPSLP